MWAPGQRKSRLKRKTWRKAGSKETSQGSTLPGQWWVPSFKAVRSFLPTHRTRAGLLCLKQMKESQGPIAGPVRASREGRGSEAWALRLDSSNSDKRWRMSVMCPPTVTDRGPERGQSNQGKQILLEKS